MVVDLARLKDLVDRASDEMLIAQRRAAAPRSVLNL
jgi:hypothetical protein